MLHTYQTRSLNDIYLEDIPYILHPEVATRNLADTARQNWVIKEWNLPDGYGIFVGRYRQFHYQAPWMAYRDTLSDIKNGNVVLCRKNITGNERMGVLTASGNLSNNLPLFLHTRLHHLILHKVMRPVCYVHPSMPVQHAQTAKTINSKAAGRLLAAGGVYNGNIEGFRNAAEQLGGDAIKGYDQVLNETTSGLMLSAASILLARKPIAAEELTSYLGKYKKTHVLLDDMDVQKINYLRRDRVEYTLLRNQFNSSIRSNYLKSISNHPDVLSTFDANNLKRLSMGNTPTGWQVHHKIPLDDGGTNNFENLILMQNAPYHSALSKTQAVITKDIPYNTGKEVLWPSPKGVVYPIKK